MGLYDFKPEDVLDLREMHAPPKKLEPAVDEVISKIIGRKIYATDPRLINLIVVKWKKRKDNNAFDNFLRNPKFIQDLKETFNQPL